MRASIFGLAFAMLLALAPALVSANDAVTERAIVRVQMNDTVWRKGTVRSVEGCRMVLLDAATPDGYTSLMFNGAQRLQLRVGPIAKSEWHEVSLQALIRSEPKQCREMGSD